jgi:hypothetical protein
MPHRVAARDNPAKHRKVLSCLQMYSILARRAGAGFGCRHSTLANSRQMLENE